MSGANSVGDRWTHRSAPDDDMFSKAYYGGVRTDSAPPHRRSLEKRHAEVRETKPMCRQFAPCGHVVPATVSD
jgi:hypothetical protein